MLYLDDSMSGSGRSEYVFSKSAVQKYSKLFVRQKKFGEKKYLQNKNLNRGLCRKVK